MPDDSFSSDDDESDRKQTDLPLHPKLELHQIHEAKVITAVNPTRFFVRNYIFFFSVRLLCSTLKLFGFQLQLTSDATIFTNMMDSLRKECENVNKIFSRNDVKVNHFYAAKLRDGYWHR